MTTPTQPGAVLAGRYRLESERGDSLPQVEHWRARDQVLARDVELYVLLEGQVDAALDAARRAALVSDPRLVRVLDVAHEDGVAFVVTEKVGGRSLAELVARGPLPADQARAIVGELAVGLETARRRGVHHLTLRPSVVYVEPSGAVVLTGLAVEGALLGLDRADARTTTRNDAVALVQLLYAALTGRWPGAATGDALALPPAPVNDTGVVPPAELVETVPNDLDTLCAVTFGPHEDGPHSPAELAADLEPWSPVHGAQLIAAAGLTEAAPAPAPSAPVEDVSQGVRRQSVRARAAGGPNPPGTPPPAAPSLPPVVPPAAASPAPEPSAPAAPAGSAPAGPPAFLAGATYVPAGAAAPSSLFPPAAVQSAARPASSKSGSKKKKRPTFNATPYVLVLVLAALVFGAMQAFEALTAPTGPATARPTPSVSPSAEETTPEDEESPSPSPSPSPSEELPPAVIASGLQLDPDGDGDEHPELVERAYDGDESTSWITRRYNDPEMPGKSGIGFEVTLEEETLVSSVTLYVDGDGGKVEVRNSTAEDPSGGDLLAESEFSPDTVLHFEEPVRTSTLVLWFPELPQTSGGENRVVLYEIELD